MKSAKRIFFNIQRLLMQLPVKQRQANTYWLSILLVVTAQSSVSFGVESDQDFFENRIRPILIDHCIECHGEKKQEGGLRLDSRDAWERGGDRGRAIQPQHPETSLLIHAIKYEDPELQMPPAQALSEQQIANLDLWIQRGAYDPRRDNTNPNPERLDLQQAKDFWSFKPLSKTEPPKAIPPAWSKNPIDAFIMHQLQEEGLAPIAVADPTTLIRRATFDLTGLPPTPSEIKQFLDDDSPIAFESLVDRLLNSPAYGERWGRHWLDIARYADTAGDGSDYPVREAGQYRNWVIDAFNADKPYDEFIREQIAGDILASNGLPTDYADCVTATGFLAIGKRYGYKASPAFQHLDFADVIDSMGRSLLGLSLGCARCHDHKYDPISAEDYYALYGILQSSQWAFPGGEEQKRPAHFPPLVPPDVASRLEQERATSLTRLDNQIHELNLKRLQHDSNYRAGGVDLGFEAQEIGRQLEPPWVSAGPIEVKPEAQSPFTHIHPAGKMGVRMGSGKPTDGIRYVFPTALSSTSVEKMHFTIDFKPNTSSQHSGAFRFYLGRGVVQSMAVEFSVTSKELAIRNGTQWETFCKLKPGLWHTLQVTIDPHTKTYAGTLRTTDETVSFNDKATHPNWDGVADCFICDGFGHIEGAACERDIDNIGLQPVAFSKPDPVPTAQALAENKSRELLADIDSRLQTLVKQRETLASQPVYPVAYGVVEAEPINARIQLRGEPYRLGDEVPRRNLQILGGEPISAGPGSGRLDLANWITHPSNPLTARVFVNRIWKWHFGRGLVSTPSDFGSRGATPTHPELLDWLAAEFMRCGWSIKAIHRRIMSSKTYQLSSSGDKKNLASDSENRFHWRFTRSPLDAESTRDAILMISGQLNRNTPPSHPFPPVESWAYTIHNPFHGVYASNHRSVYLMIQRNRRHPYLSLFDAADPNQSVAQRLPTTTPSQALFLMNSRFVHEQADSFSQRIDAIPGDIREKIKWAFLVAHGRSPDKLTIEHGVDFIAAYNARTTRQNDGTLKESEGWSAFARVLLTSNAFLYLD